MIRVLSTLLLCLSALAAVAAEMYVVDPDHTSARFAVNHQGLSTTHGRFDKVSGTVSIDVAAKAGEVDISIDVASVSTGRPALDEHLRKPDFFDVAVYPAITFKSSDFRFEGEQLVAVHGELTLHGVTKLVTLEVGYFACRPHRGIPTCGADLTTTVKRSDFGMTRFLNMLGDEVSIGIQIEAVKPKPKL